MTPSIEPAINGKEFKVLDQAGCLTQDAMYFTEQLGLHHQAVVERHIKVCNICAQQVTAMAAVANKFRLGKPRVPIPSEIKLLSRQLALRSIALRAPAPRKATPAPARTGKRSPNIRRPWYRSHSFQMALIGALSTTLVIMLLALLFSGCKRGEETEAPPPPATAVKITNSKVLAKVGTKVSAAAAGPGDLFAVGTTTGQVLLLKLTPGKAAEQVPLEAFYVQKAGVDAGPPKKRLLHTGGVTGLAFSGKDRLVSVGGRTAALWDLTKRALISAPTGPQGLTTVIRAVGLGEVFFATDQGHVLRWDLTKKAAEPVKGFFCGSSQVPPARLRLPASRRCVYGVYHVSKKGVHVCHYPANALLLHDGQLVRACRSGNMSLLDLKTRKSRFYMSGYVQTMASLSAGELLLARDDGELRVYHAGEGKVRRTMKLGGRPRAAAASERLALVARDDAVLIWPLGGDKVLGAVKTPSPTVWMRMVGDELQLLMKDGDLVSHKLEVK